MFGWVVVIGLSKTKRQEKGTLTCVGEVRMWSLEGLVHTVVTRDQRYYYSTKYKYCRLKTPN